MYLRNGGRKYMDSFSHQAMLHISGDTQLINRASRSNGFCFSSVLRVSQQRGKQGGAGVEPGTET